MSSDTFKKAPRPYVPLPEQIRRFFADNPGEELTASDAAIKFDISEHMAGRYLSKLSGAGELRRVSLYTSAE